MIVKTHKMKDIKDTTPKERSRVRIPVATSNESGEAKLTDVSSGRRKRVRIATPVRIEPNNNDYKQKRPDTLKKNHNNYEKEYFDNVNRSNAFKGKGNNKSKPLNKNTNKNKNFNKGTNRNINKSKLPEPIKFDNFIGTDEDVRLNKYIANSGICSRREADIIISKGEVTVNGKIVTELGTRVRATDEVICKGQKISVESKVYILLNKPKNCVTTLDDPEGRKTVMDIVRNACNERVYPVGRLDRNTTGVLLLTNDGELASRLTHPSFMKKKIYHVWLDKDISSQDMQKIVDGIALDDGEIHADAISYVQQDDLKQVGIEIHSGRNRIVRRIFEHLGYKVTKLDRVYFSGLTKKNLPRGKWRFLDAQEVRNLKSGFFE